MEYRTGIGWDVHTLERGRPLMLGCLHFEDSEVGLSGHSDADVVSHAICDALLGAAALGDIGEHFPDSNPQYKDAPGSDLLKRVRAMVDERFFAIVNIDCTVMSDVVHLGGRKREMADAIAKHLGVKPAAVNVKATTCEGHGAVGRGEVIACQAIVLLKQV